MRGFNFKKAVQALNLLACNSGGSLNKMKALKLIWLCDRLSLRRFGRTITGDDYYALANGLVPSATRDILESTDFIEDTAIDYSSAYLIGVDRYNYKSVTQPNKKVFSETDIDVIEEIFQKYGNLDHFELSELSHLFPEWKKYESALIKKLSSRFQVNQLDFFQNLDDGRGLFVDEEKTLIPSKRIFEENTTLQSII